MALRPVDFSVQQRRPSPIEQAFAAALTTAATELVSGPFEKARERRRNEAELTQLRERGKIELNQARELGDIQFGRHLQEAYTPWSPQIESTLRNWGAVDPNLYSISYDGRRYISNALLQKVGSDLEPTNPTQQDIFTQLRRDGLQLQTPLTQKAYQQAEGLVGETVQARAIGEAAAARKLSRQGSVMNVMANLYNNPNMAQYAGAVTAKSRRSLSMEEMRALANQTTAETLANDPTAFDEVRTIAKNYMSILQRLEQEEGGVIFPRTTSIKVEDIMTRAGRLRTDTEEAQGYATSLLYFPVKLLRGSDGQPVINDGDVATQALKNNDMLATAVIAADMYGSAERVLQAERQGLGELPARAKQYMQYIFYMRGMPWDLGEPMLGTPQQGYPDLRHLPGQKPQPGDTSTTSAAGAAPNQTALGQAVQAGGAAKGPVGPQVNVSPALQPTYQWFFGALASDTSAYPRLQERLNEIFMGTPEEIAGHLERYGFPKATADSVRHYPHTTHRIRRALEESLRQARADLLHQTQ